MMQRILVLTAYFLRSLFFSLAGLIYIVLALVYWHYFFPPGEHGQDPAYYILLIGVLGAIVVFLATLSVSARANRAENYPLMVRLPGRVEYLTAVFLTAFSFGLLLQLVVAVLAFIREPGLTPGIVLDIIPIWITLNVLAIMLALHATDLVASGWSRVIIFGLLALLLLGQSTWENFSQWLMERLTDLSYTLVTQQLTVLATMANRLSNWLQNGGTEMIGRLFSAAFWPFRATLDAVFQGYFTPVQALAPALLLLYATILFLIAADLFANKDLSFIE